MTAEEAAVLAMARTSEITDQYPSTRSLMYRRLGLRQRELMALAGRENPEYYGVCAISPLDDEFATDLNDIIEPVPTPELISLFKVEDAGSSQWSHGDEITIVPAHDKGVELPPRATLRDLVFQGVDDDLDGVVSIEIMYSRIAAPFGPLDGGSVLELQNPYDEILIVDLTKHLLRKATRLPKDIRDTAIAGLVEEENGLVDKYLSHVRSYIGMTTRFQHRTNR